MYTPKGLKLQPKKKDIDYYQLDLYKYANPDWLNNCISYAVNGVYYIRDKNQNNKIIKTFTNEEEYQCWRNDILYDF